jgi:hypothetical protein
VVRANRPHMTPELASRITEEAVKVVAAAVRPTEHGLRPSRIVDEG